MYLEPSTLILISPHNLQRRMLSWKVLALPIREHIFLKPMEKESKSNSEVTLHL